MTKLPKNFNFPQSMKQLEELNEYFSSTDLDLTQALEKFQKAQELIKNCQSYLDQLQTQFHKITPPAKDEMSS